MVIIAAHSIQPSRSKTVIVACNLIKGTHISIYIKFKSSVCVVSIQIHIFRQTFTKLFLSVPQHHRPVTHYFSSNHSDYFQYNFSIFTTNATLHDVASDQELTPPMQLCRQPTWPDPVSLYRPDPVSFICSCSVRGGPVDNQGGHPWKITLLGVRRKTTTLLWVSQGGGICAAGKKLLCSE